MLLYIRILLDQLDQPKPIVLHACQQARDTPVIPLSFGTFPVHVIYSLGGSSFCQYLTNSARVLTVHYFMAWHRTITQTHTHTHTKQSTNKQVALGQSPPPQIAIIQVDATIWHYIRSKSTGGAQSRRAHARAAAILVRRRPRKCSSNSLFNRRCRRNDMAIRSLHYLSINIFI